MNQNYRWLNEYSQKFLERDYLIEGQSVDDRVNIICNTAEKILNKPGYATRLKENFQKGWYSFSTPIWTNFGNDRGLPISCVVGNTWINTKHDGGKLAKDIVIGDEVLTHKGRYKPVIQIIVTDKKSGIYRLKTKSRTTDLYLTGDHLVLTNLGWVRADELDKNHHLVAANSGVFIENENYNIEIQEDITNKEPYCVPSVSNISVDKDLAWALGLWFTNVNSFNDSNQVGITCYSDRAIELAKKWLTIISNKFQLDEESFFIKLNEDSFYTPNDKGKSDISITTHSNTVVKFFTSFENKLLPHWIIALPNYILNSFLEGCLLGNDNTKEKEISLPDPRLVLQLYQIGLKLNKKMSLEMNEGISTISFEDIGEETKDWQYCEIIEINKTDRTETVFDFTVEDDHSFSAAGVVLHNCFGSYLDDTMDSIAYTWAEVCMMTKHGGGTSGYFGNLRERGSLIRDNGKSSGSVHFMQPFENLINVVSQGNTRRGNFAAYLSVDHPDIMEFLQIRSDGAPIQDLSFGVCIPDYWMEEMIGDGTPQGGDQKKRKVWARILEARANSGYPFLFFSGNANNNTVDCYKDKKMEINHSNLCVTGDQLVVTSEGIKRVVDLYKEGNELTLFDGEKAVKASPMKLIEKNAKVFEIKTKKGRSHKVTDYHKIKTIFGMISAKCLRPGDQIHIQEEKGLFGSIDDPNMAFLLGHFQGGGYEFEDEITIKLCNDDYHLVYEIEDSIRSIYEKMGWDLLKIKHHTFHTKLTRSKIITSKELYTYGFRKNLIPEWILQGNENTQANYLKGLFYKNAGVYLGAPNGESSTQIHFLSLDRNFLQEIQIILSNFGIDSEVSEVYEKKYRLCISENENLVKIEKITELLAKRGLFLNPTLFEETRSATDEILSVTFVGNEDVYCTTVDSKEHVWVCNGFITSNCTEIMLPDSAKESFVCDLSSLNILYYDEWKNTDAVEILVYFLDAVMTEFINKAKQIPFMNRTVEFAERHRALGIGWLGWHSYLQSKMIPWESMDAKFLNVAVAKTIKEGAYKASEKLAQEYGEPEICKGYGRRNTTLLAIAPTKSSAFILGQVSEGIEPHRTNYYIKDLQKGKFTIKNTCLESLLKEKGKDTPEIWESILINSGSVQHLDFLDQHEKNVFKTFSEISPMEIVIQAAQRQKYIDQGQSLNILIHPSVPIKDVNRLIIEGWKMGIKSFYYQISVNAAQAFARNILTCASCEG